MFDGLEERRPAAPVAWLNAAALFGALAAWSVFSFDRRVALWSHDVLGQPHWAKMLAALGDVRLLLGVGVVALLAALALGRAHRPLARDIGAALIAVGLAVILVICSKHVFGRTWPETWVDNNPSFIKDQVYGFFWLHGGVGYNSFPSGHTARVVAPCAVIGLRVRQMRPLAYALPVIVAAGLIGANFHFLGDCLGGVALGLAVAFWSDRLARRIGLD
jgi:membrane-associated phospholipid phosphatase